MPTPAATTAMESILTYVERDPGIQKNVSNADIAGGVAGGRMMNNAIGAAIEATGVNNDGRITSGDIKKISDHIRANPALYGEFVIGHGDDEGNDETGFHLVQSDGGTLQFQGRDYVDTVADAIYHVGFRYREGRILNEDGNDNETLVDIAGWLNYFVNGQNRVYGSSNSETLHSGDYSNAFAAARNEIFTAGAGADKVWAGDGDDIVWAGLGHDKVGGGDGHDTIDGAGGNDHLYGEGGRDKITGGIGEDRIGGGYGADRLYGGKDMDHIYGEGGNDRLEGGAGRDKLGGGDGDDSLKGEDGNDTLYGDDGFDTIFGGAGDDRIGGGQNADKIFGGGGADLIGGDHGNDKIYGGGNNDKIYGGDGFDWIDGGEGGDEIHGGNENDKLYGSAGRDKIYGGDGKDRISGGDGLDHLHGQNGDDLLLGRAGNDALYGGAGRDRFVGGTGADLMHAWESNNVKDVFVFAPGDTGIRKSSRDTIEGFKSRIDKIDLTGFDNLRFVKDADFNGTGRGEVSFLGRTVMIDADGDAQIDAMIEMKYVDSMVRDDFIL